MNAKIYVFDEIRQVIEGPKNKGVYVYGNGADGAFLGFVKTGCYIKWENNLYLVDGSKLKTISNTGFKLDSEIKMMEKETMNKQQWQNRIDELEKELVELKAHPPKREPGERWLPEEGEMYWVIDEDYETNCFTWRNDDFDNAQFDNFNVFQTKEEAAFSNERTKVMRELDLWAIERSKQDFHDFYLQYDSSTQIIQICAKLPYRHYPHTFETKEIAKKAIKAIGEDRLKKYYFRVVE